MNRIKLSQPFIYCRPHGVSYWIWITNTNRWCGTRFHSQRIRQCWEQPNSCFLDFHIFRCSKSIRSLRRGQALGARLRLQISSMHCYTNTFIFSWNFIYKPAIGGNLWVQVQICTSCISISLWSVTFCVNFTEKCVKIFCLMTKTK